VLREQVGDEIDTIVDVWWITGDGIVEPMEADGCVVLPVGVDPQPPAGVRPQASSR
jgi:hypothetical protein